MRPGPKLLWTIAFSEPPFRFLITYLKILRFRHFIIRMKSFYNDAISTKLSCKNIFEMTSLLL